jgi:hypothetical protein
LDSSIGAGTRRLELDEGRAAMQIRYGHSAKLRLRLRKGAASGSVDLGTLDLSQLHDGQEFAIDVDPEALRSALAKIRH